MLNYLSRSAGDRGEISALEVVEQLLLEELTFREDRRIRTALRMGRLNTIKTLSGYDFSFQPSLDKARILALAELTFLRAARWYICWVRQARARATSPVRSASRPSRPAKASRS